MGTLWYSIGISNVQQTKGGGYLSVACICQFFKNNVWISPSEIKCIVLCKTLCSKYTYTFIYVVIKLSTILSALNIYAGTFSTPKNREGERHAVWIQNIHVGLYTM